MHVFVVGVWKSRVQGCGHAGVGASVDVGCLLRGTTPRAGTLPHGGTARPDSLHEAANALQPPRLLVTHLHEPLLTVG